MISAVANSATRASGVRRRVMVRAPKGSPNTATRGHRRATCAPACVVRCSIAEQPLALRAHGIQPQGLDSRPRNRARDAEDFLPGRSPQRRPDVNRIDAVPGRPEVQEAHAMGAGQCRQAGVHLLRRRDERLERESTRRKEDRPERMEPRRRQPPNAVHRQIREDDVIRDASEPRQRLVDPGQNLLGREAVDDVVADVGDERLGGDGRCRLQLLPDPGLEDGRQSPEQEGAVGSVRAPVAERRDDLDVRPPGRPCGRDHRLESAGQVARAERDDAGDAGHEPSVACGAASLQE